MNAIVFWERRLKEYMKMTSKLKHLGKLRCTTKQQLVPKTTISPIDE